MHLSIFLPSLSDTSIALSNELIDKHLLPTFIRSHQNDLAGNPMPETRKYPPTNEAMLIIPPTHREWESTQQRRFELRPPLGLAATYIHHPPLAGSVAADGSIDDDDIIAITFKSSDDDSKKISVLIDDPLSIDSSMEEVMEEEGVFDEFDGGIKSKVQILLDSGRKLTLKYTKFKGMTVR